MSGSPALAEAPAPGRVSRMAGQWTHVALAWLPFADAATVELPLSRLLRLALFR